MSFVVFFRLVLVVDIIDQQSEPINSFIQSHFESNKCNEETLSLTNFIPIDCSVFFLNRRNSLELMAERHFDSREGGRYHTDPSSSSRFNANMKFHRRGGIRTITQRPVPNRPGTSGQSGESITVSVHRTLSGGSTRTLGTSGLRGRPYQPKQIHPGPSGQDSANANQEKWWRVSILQAGSIGKERVMSTLKAHCMRQFQAYHVRRTSNTSPIHLLL